MFVILCFWCVLFYVVSLFGFDSKFYFVVVVSRPRIFVIVLFRFRLIKVYSCRSFIMSIFRFYKSSHIKESFISTSPSFFSSLLVIYEQGFCLLGTSKFTHFCHGIFSDQTRCVSTRVTAENKLTGDGSQISIKKTVFSCLEQTFYDKPVFGKESFATIDINSKEHLPLYLRRTSIKRKRRKSLNQS